MSDAEGVDACRRRTRMTSVIAAVVVALVLWLVIDLNFFVALLLAVISFFVLSWFLGRSCNEAAAKAPTAQPVTAPIAPASSVATAGSATESATEASVEAAVAPEAAEPVAGGTEPTAPVGGAHWSSSVNAASGKASATRGQTGIKPSAELADEATLRNDVGSWTYQGDAKPAAPEAAPTAAPNADAEEKPVTLTAARAEGADDLTRIKGVGPGIAKTLNELGFYHFDQIAAWTSAEVEWVDSRLKFKGRIVRDNWIDQARAFATGA